MSSLKVGETLLFMFIVDVQIRLRLLIPCLDKFKWEQGQKLVYAPGETQGVDMVKEFYSMKHIKNATFQSSVLLFGYNVIIPGLYGNTAYNIIFALQIL